MSRHLFLSLAFLASSLLAVSASAEAPRKGEGSIGVEFQYVHSDKFFDLVAKYDYWTTDTQVLMLSGDYTFADGWSVFVSLPYVRKRFNSEVPWGGDPHNPNDAWWVDFVPPDTRFIDDGDYHGGLQDLSVIVSYVALDGPLTIAPYIGYGTPVDDYPFYAKAAIGANLWKIPVGASFNYIPYFSDWHFNGNVSYVFSEEPLGINVDYWSVHLSAGYWFRPNLSVNAFAGLKYTIDGLVMPWSFTDDPFYGDYPDAFDTEEWYNHDRLLRHRNLNMGLGVDYFPTERYRVSGTWYTGVWTEMSNEIDNAFTVGVTRYFGND